MITADELRKRAEQESVVRISDEDALMLADRVDADQSAGSLAIANVRYRDALYQIAGGTEDNQPPYRSLDATLMSQIAKRALGYI